MDNNEFNNKVISNVRSKIVISNLEREENMKIRKKKQVISIVALLIIVLSGGIITVDATNNGQITKKIKENIKVVFQKKDGTKEELKGKQYTDKDGHVKTLYEMKDGEKEFKLETDDTLLEEENLTVDGSINNEIVINVK